MITNLNLTLKNPTEEPSTYIRRGNPLAFMKEIQCASSLETVLEGSAMSISYSEWSTCYQDCYFFLSPSSLAARLGVGAIWSMTHWEGRKGDLRYKTSIDQARQKHNCVKFSHTKKFSHHISRAALLMDILTSY